MNTFGKNLIIRVFGESHSPVVGISMENVPAGIPLRPSDFAKDLQRRKMGDLPHLSFATTTRKEADKPHIISGVKKGLTTGGTLVIEFENRNIRGEDYEPFNTVPRPGHADFVSIKKYGGVSAGGGIFSGRMSVALVAAGVVAKKIAEKIEIHAGVKSIGNNPDSSQWAALLTQVQEDKDSIGGVVECCATNLPIGLGAPFFDSMESQISHLAFSVPGVKGIEFGNGFACTTLRGSENNDRITTKGGKTATNNAGGINGGLTNGNPLIFRVAIKPASSIGKPQKSINLKNGKITSLQITGRHDACIALRCPVIMEAVCAIVLADNLLNHK